MSDFRFTDPTAMIQIELPDRRRIEGPRGRRLGEFLNLLIPELNADLAGGIVDGELRELSYPMTRNAVVKPVTMRDPDGFIIYKRSLVFLLAACFEKLFPNFDLEVKHSIDGGGTLCNVTGPRAFTTADREILEAEMWKMVREDLPIVREEIPIDKAIALYEEKKQFDKVDMLRVRKKPYLMTYTVGNFRDYFYGYMLPSTGCLKYFGLEDSGEEDRFLLRHPANGLDTKIGTLDKYQRMQGIFDEYNTWQKNLNIHMLSSINRAIEENRIEAVINVSESLQNRQFMKAAETIAAKRDQIRVIMIAGPSSSGKTTSSKKLSIELLVNGISPIPIEMDNFFLDRTLTPRDENGNYDFETVYALNIPLFQNCMRDLIAGKVVQLPRFDFVTGKSVPGDVLQLKENQILIVEGIHGLNPIMQEHLPKEKVFRIFVSPLTQVNMDRYNRVSILDVRLLRRIVRDFRDRGYSAQDTIGRWESVRNGERKYINPYSGLADLTINTSLVYEAAALKDLAEPALRMVPFGVPEYNEAKRLLSFLEWVKPIDRSLIPANSILAEFVGGSNLKNFISWDA